jgi:hypothetical protein
VVIERVSPLRERAARRKWTANQPMGQEVVQQQLIINSV